MSGFELLTELHVFPFGELLNVRNNLALDIILLLIFLQLENL